MLMKKDRAILLVVTALVGLGGLVVAQYLIGLRVMKTMEQRRPTPSAAWKLIYDAVLEKGDLPPGWKDGGVQLEEEPDTEEGRLFWWFYNPPGPELVRVSVSEILLVYPTVEMAEVGYLEQRDMYFPPHAADAWKQIPELEVAHHADQMKVACLPWDVSEGYHYACGAVWLAMTGWWWWCWATSSMTSG
jgi:hypothetical protein